MEPWEAPTILSPTRRLSMPGNPSKISVMVVYSPSCEFSVRMLRQLPSLAHAYPTIPFVAINHDHDFHLSPRYLHSVGLPLFVVYSAGKYMRKAVNLSGLARLLYTEFNMSPCPVPDVLRNKIPHIELAPSTDWMMWFSVLFLLGWLFSHR